MQKSWDIAVVGLGAMGSAALYQLSRHPGRVLGIDSFTPPHDKGSSHGNTRITRQAIGEGRQYVPLAMRSREIWRSLERESGASLYIENGLLVFAREGKSRSDHGVADFLDQTVGAAVEFGIGHELLDQAALRRRFPQFRYNGDEVGYYEASGGYLRPEHCIAANLACAQLNGAELQLEQRVIAIEPGASGEGVILRCERDTIKASRVIVAAGAWMPRFLPDRVAGKLRRFRQTLHWFPLRGHPAPYAPERCPVFIRLSDAHSNMVYGFPAVNGPDGGLKVASEQFEEDCDPDTMERTVTAAETEKIWRMASQFLPLGTKPLKQTTCVYTVTPDFGFLIDRHPQFPQVILASACSGHGFKHSAAIGEILAELALGLTPQLDISPFAYARYGG